MSKFKVSVSLNVDLEIPETELTVDYDGDDPEDFTEAAEEAAIEHATAFVNNLPAVLRNVVTVELESADSEGVEGTLDMLDD